MAGTSNATEVMSVIEQANSLGIITGEPGSWSVITPPVSTSKSGVRGQISAGAAAAPTLSALSLQQIQTAVAKSNAAAVATPSAASGQPTKADTSLDDIKKAIQDVKASSIADDIKKLEAGSTGQLEAYGWTVEMDELATKALESLLTTDLQGLLGVAAALTAVSAPLAAIAAVVDIAGIVLGQWLSSEDSGNGVTITGYGWVAVWVTGND